MLWLGDVIAQVFVQVVIEVVFLMVMRYPAAFLLWLCFRKGRSFEQFLKDTNDMAVGQGTLGALLFALVIVLVANS